LQKNVVLSSLTSLFAIIDISMALIASDQNMQFSQILEGFDCPAILVSIDYDILATNHHCESAFGELSPDKTHRCFEFSHRYKVPCDQAGEDCPLGTAKHSAHKEHVLHIHQTPWEKEHVDLEMLPIHDQGGILIYCVELLHRVPLASGDLSSHELIGESALFKKMLNKVSRVGKSDAAVLLLSESGTGKELAARAIHMASSRKDNPMVAL
jgi:transcriptional regulator with PAS, ATPase and Fis domain